MKIEEMRRKEAEETEKAKQKAKPEG